MLKQFIRILELFAGEIRYGRSTLSECCEGLAIRLKEPYRECFRQIFRKMKEGDGISFDEVYRESMTSCLDQLPLTPADRELILQVFSGREHAEASMQERALVRHRQALEETVEQLEQEAAGRCRVAVGLGAMSGILLVIILL